MLRGVYRKVRERRGGEGGREKSWGRRGRGLEEEVLFSLVSRR